MNIIKYFKALSVMLVCLTGLAHAGVETPAGGITITLLGVSVSGTQAFFNTTELPAGNAPRNCLYGMYYVDLSSASGRLIYTTLLAAQSSGRKLLRLDWALQGASPQMCYVSLIQLQD
ncbi:hypothetical protein IGB42_04165 [Andreprevotia sp. IGB-42]|uniref:hypothetical protein n=1 Tax=Andreprevotia sp. IGB-42 TaxID=2497473 RepID=UPI00135A873D|nr:hypothetical protein [Andreprevotia sp. IGB-42]KAF0811399.1 hypothetical protein IGB42_04165 [Andreprevotia sp. IGB-42]